MDQIYGNTASIRQTLLNQLKTVYELEIANKEFCTTALIDALCTFTHATGREVMVYLDRSGEVLSVAVGDQDRVELPSLSTRRSLERLSGIRCIHTHPNADGRLSPVDLQSLKKLKMDAMAAVGVNKLGEPTTMYVSILNERTPEGDYTINVLGPYAPNKVPHKGLFAEIRAADERVRPPQTQKVERERERVILAGIEPATPEYDPLEELAQLCDTADLEVVQTIRQNRAKADRATYLGQGKIRELALLVQAWDAGIVIFDDELSPAQIRNIEGQVGGARILDRTSLILDIFARRANTREGRLQVELAQIRYLLPRLTGWGAMMSRLGGGGGGGGGARRGVGEMQLELDRRRSRIRIQRMEEEIQALQAQRDVRRAARQRNAVPVVALVGYTNAGKSTLLNLLSGSDVLAEDKLFATLDPTSRRVESPGGAFLLVDTVGFINKLPHDLVRAFRATLEEVCHADLLLHIVDATSPARVRQMKVVESVLTELGAQGKPTLTIYNKTDALEQPIEEGQDVSLSALQGRGTVELLEAITKGLSDHRSALDVVLPHSMAHLVSQAYEQGQVVVCEYLEEGIHLQATAPAALANRLRTADINYVPEPEETW